MVREYPLDDLRSLIAADLLHIRTPDQRERLVAVDLQETHDLSVGEHAPRQHSSGHPRRRDVGLERVEHFDRRRFEFALLLDTPSSIRVSREPVVRFDRRSVLARASSKRSNHLHQDPQKYDEAKYGRNDRNAAALRGRACRPRIGFRDPGLDL